MKGYRVVNISILNKAAADDDDDDDMGKCLYRLVEIRVASTASFQT